MIDGLSGTATAPPVPVPKTAAASPAIASGGKAAEPAPEKEAPKAAAQATAPLQGFNPALSIDPESHVVVMTFSGPDGKVLDQLPSKQQLAAYKASAAKS